MEAPPQDVDYGATLDVRDAECATESPRAQRQGRNAVAAGAFVVMVALAIVSHWTETDSHANGAERLFRGGNGANATAEGTYGDVIPGGPVFWLFSLTALLSVAQIFTGGKREGPAMDGMDTLLLATYLFALRVSGHFDWPSIHFSLFLWPGIILGLIGTLLGLVKGGNAKHRAAIVGIAVLLLSIDALKRFNWRGKRNWAFFITAFLTAARTLLNKESGADPLDRVLLTVYLFTPGNSLPTFIAVICGLVSTLMGFSEEHDAMKQHQPQKWRGFLGCLAVAIIVVDAFLFHIIPHGGSFPFIVFAVTVCIPVAHFLKEACSPSQEGDTKRFIKAFDELEILLLCSYIYAMIVYGPLVWIGVLIGGITSISSMLSWGGVDTVKQYRAPLGAAAVVIIVATAIIAHLRHNQTDGGYYYWNSEQ